MRPESWVLHPSPAESAEKFQWLNLFLVRLLAVSLLFSLNELPEAALYRCYKKAFWKYAANLQKNGYAEVWFQ